MYNKRVLNRFSEPRFFGKIKNPDVIGKAGNPRCGDTLNLYLKIDKKTKKIKDIKFETWGCVAAISASDMVCELAKGKTLDQALKISFKDVSEKLGTLPPLKIHCAHLVTEALKDAIKKYSSK